MEKLENKKMRKGWKCGRKRGTLALPNSVWFSGGKVEGWKSLVFGWKKIERKKNVFCINLLSYLLLEKKKYQIIFLLYWDGEKERFDLRSWSIYIL